MKKQILIALAVSALCITIIRVNSAASTKTNTLTIQALRCAVPAHQRKGIKCSPTEIIQGHLYLRSKPISELPAVPGVDANKLLNAAKSAQLGKKGKKSSAGGACAGGACSR